MQSKNITLNEVLIEFRTIGKVTRVSAIDPITNTEVVTVGDTSRGRKELARVAEQKLRYVLSRNIDKTSG